MNINDIVDDRYSIMYEFLLDAYCKSNGIGSLADLQRSDYQSFVDSVYGGFPVPDLVTDSASAVFDEMNK